ncbi:MAG: hypothetical protein ACE5H9_01710 [Anaerolineae bacterium]
MAEFNLIRHELRKLTEMPPWGRLQGDRWDRLSEFVYRIKTLRGLRRQARARAKAEGLDVEAFESYALRRWFNHHTHNEILAMFLAHPDVQPEENRRHRTIDFYLRGIPFDLKVSRFPRAFPHSIEAARANPHLLAKWQYEHQSRQGRYHIANRCFVILHHRANPKVSWRLRCDFAGLQDSVRGFLDAPTLLGLAITDHHTRKVRQPWAAVIFYVK